MLPKYVQVAFHARGLDPDFDGYPMCERCEMWRAQDVDHIFGRKGSLMLDPKNLLFVCRNCHINKGGYNRKMTAKAIVEAKISKHLK